MTAYPGQTRTTLSQLCAALWDSQSRPDVVQPGFEPGTVMSPLELRCSALNNCVHVCVNYLTFKHSSTVNSYRYSLFWQGKYRYRTTMSYRRITNPQQHDGGQIFKYTQQKKKRPFFNTLSFKETLYPMLVQ